MGAGISLSKSVAGTAPRSAFSAGDFVAPGIRRLCDVVMKGGITSGVVYPPAICKLATSFVIKSIGGTSVGAIAAAVTAAAEYRRRNGSGDGFVELAKLPDFLARPGALLALFAADRQARRLLKLALIPIGNASLTAKGAQLILALFVHYFWIPLLCIAAVFGLIVAAASEPAPQTLWRYLLVAVVVGTIAALVFIGIRVVVETFRVLSRNNFGWCHGYDRAWDAKLASCSDVTMLEAKDVPPLFNWLEAFIAQTAGRPASEPLTFGDLWGAQDPQWHDHSPTERGIDFRMVTTCLNLGRPFALPFDPNDKISLTDDKATDGDAENPRPSIYFRREDLEKYFSQAVVDHMVRNGQATEIGKTDAITYYRFPAAAKLPIVVATRMSMSFPVLFCAFPLYACDARGQMQRIWFSDGGLTSNFPVHFFDCPLPHWPTFAIDLLRGAPESAEKDGAATHAAFAAQPNLAMYASGAVFMESERPRGTVNPWDRLDHGEARGNVLAFASSILDAARTWQDVTGAGLPGNASRIVAIRLSDKQGGLNLNMPPETIGEMTGLGLEAGGRLVDVFATGTPEPPGWKTHRWIRYRATMGAITRWIAGFASGYAPFVEQPLQQSYAALITELVEIDKQPPVQDATQKVAAVPVVETFYKIEEQPIAVLPTRPVV
jgi:predicted acylesterase/phospholipase RssA